MPTCCCRRLRARDQGRRLLTSYELHRVPPRLAFVTVGNMRNRDLLFLFMGFMDRMRDSLQGEGFIELGRSTVTVR